ncbi:MAG: hypothetical protein EPO64_04985 [Nitrospirae bacterium]|nr:MAG: hypothetical protein EPO64_04985 [Nitrospirota bacterium]
MQMFSIARFCPVFACALLFFIGQIPHSAAVETDPYEAAVQKSENLMKRGEFVEALSAAQEAIRLDEKPFAGHYQAALALYYQESVDRAERSARAALARAPADQRAVVERLIEAIGKKRIYWERTRAGDDALARGYITKAAAEYTEAWRAMPSRAEIGLKAAKLWEQRQEFTEGAKILRELAKQTQDPAVAQEARHMLNAWKDTLSKLGWEKWKEGYELYGRWDEADRYYFHQGRDSETAESVDLARRAVSALMLAFDALQHQDYAVSAAAILAWEKKDADAIALLGRGAREAGLRVEQILKEPRVRRLAGNEQFVAFLEATYGASAVTASAAVRRELTDLSGLWDLSAGPFPFGPMRIVQQGADVTITIERNDNAHYPGAKAGSLQFEGVRQGQRLTGSLILYGAKGNCPKETAKVAVELLLSDDGLEIISIPPRHYLVSKGQGGGSTCEGKAEDHDSYYWTRTTGR